MIKNKAAYTISFETLTPKLFESLYRTVGWESPCIDQIETALNNSYAKFVAYDGDKPVGMVKIEADATHKYLNVLKRLGKPSPKIDTKLEHMIITGMFNTYFELIIHEMPIEDAKLYLKEMREFYTAGWMKIMGQD